MTDGLARKHDEIQTQQLCEQFSCMATLRRHSFVPVANATPPISSTFH